MTEQLITVAPDVHLRVAVDGDPSRTPLALINGAFCNLDVWTPAMPALLERFFVVRHDWRGTGKSSKGPRADYDFARYADDLLAVLDQLDIERPLVCGMAYGARTAARFALRHPARLSALALYDVSLDQPVDQTLQAAGNAEAKQLRAEAALPPVKVDRAWYAHDDEREAMRSLTAHRDQPDPTPELAALRLPTLIVCGRQDVNLPEAERIASIVPGAALQIMEMTGHGSVLSRPELFVQLLVAFADVRTQTPSS